MSCILRHWGVQLILAYSWARPAAILVAGKGRGGMFLFLPFLHFGLNIFISINSTYIHTILRISNGIQKEAKRLIRICFPI